MRLRFLLPALAAALIGLLADKPARANIVLTDTSVYTFVVGNGTPNPGKPYVYSNGHGDIGVGYEDGGLFLHYHFGTNAVINGTALGAGLDPEEYEFDPTDVATLVTRQSSFSRPADGAVLDFLGITGDSASIWNLPQNRVTGVPFLGFATEELPLDLFVSGEWAVTGWSGSGFDDGGEFGIWQALGSTTNFLAGSYNRSAAENVFPAGELGGHDHFFMGFTRAGVYNVEFTFRGVAVPEPTSITLVGLGLGLVALVRPWRRRPTAPAPR